MIARNIEQFDEIGCTDAAYFRVWSAAPLPVTLKSKVASRGQVGGNRADSTLSEFDQVSTAQTSHRGESNGAREF